MTWRVSLTDVNLQQPFLRLRLYCASFHDQLLLFTIPWSLVLISIPHGVHFADVLLRMEERSIHMFVLTYLRKNPSTSNQSIPVKVHVSEHYPSVEWEGLRVFFEQSNRSGPAITDLCLINQRTKRGVSTCPTSRGPPIMVAQSYPVWASTIDILR